MPIFLKNRKRNPWRGKVKRTGFKEEYAYFPTRDEAKEWEEIRSSALRRKAKGLPADIADLGKITIGSMVEKYLKEETAHKASSNTEVYRINNFIEYKDFKTRPLIAFSRPDAIEYRNYLEREYQCQGKVYIRNGKTIINNRKPKPIKAGTVRRTIATFRDMWNIASNDWRGYEALKQIGNPWSGVSSKQIPKKRTRRLNDLPSRNNELDRLIDACKGCIGLNKIYMKLGISLAVSVGLRRQEILNLTWNDVDLETNRINIRKSKTDYRSETEGRFIVLPLTAKIDLLGFMAALEITPLRKEYPSRKGNTKIIHLTDSAFEQAWDELRHRAGIPTKEEDTKAGIREGQCGLEFKDLRREAGSRFDEAGLTKAEHDLMLGHESKDIAGVYIAPYLDRIEKKINEYWRDNPQLWNKTAINAFSKGLQVHEMLGHIALDMVGIDVSQILATGYDITGDGTIINNETKEPIPEEVARNVIPFLRKASE